MEPQSQLRRILILLMVIVGFKDRHCLGAKLERKQDFFDVDSFDSSASIGSGKRGYGLSEIGKRGFSSSLGFDYSPSTSSDFDFGTRTVSSSSGVGSEEVLSPARDLIPPPAPSIYSSSTSSSPQTRSDYSKFGRLSSSSSSSGKEFHPSPLFTPPYTYKSQISRRSPHLQRQSSSSSSRHYFDDISPSSSLSSSSSSGSRGRYTSHGASFGLVADTEGKLIGYRGSLLPGYSSSSSSASPSPDTTNFIGGYYSSSPSPSSKYLSSSASSSSTASLSSGRYTSTPIYYPGKEEDHTYRMRDSTSQGYDDEDGPISSTSSEDDFPPYPNPHHHHLTSTSSFSHSPPGPPYHHHHNHNHLRESDGLLGRHRSFLPYASSSSEQQHPPGFSYGPLGKNHNHSRLVNYDYPAKRTAFGPPASSPSTYDSVERTTSPYGFHPPLGYADYGGSPPI